MKRIRWSGQVERLRHARAFMDEHYNMPLTVERVSQEAAFSPFHFIRLFHTAYRQTPHQYLMRRRLERAKTLLRSSDLSITEVCQEVGFDSLGSFSTLFRRMVGLSPSLYRERSAAPRRDDPPSFVPLCFRIKHNRHESHL